LWMDEKGYAGAYDFLLWFPAKQTCRLNSTSYAFVNFRSAAHAASFRKEFHMKRFPSQQVEPEGGKQQWSLSVPVAKVQGFEENFIRFYHLLDNKSPTLCQPFFAEDSIEKLSPEVREKATQAGSNALRLDNLSNGPSTTLIVRNLPPSLESQEETRQWLDNFGFAGQYDFLLWFPSKRKQGELASSKTCPQQGLAYAFVNLRSPEQAFKCAEFLNGHDPALNVVAARVQGLNACLEHFSNLGDSSRASPWFDPEAASLTATQPVSMRPASLLLRCFRSRRGQRGRTGMK